MLMMFLACKSTDKSANDWYGAHRKKVNFVLFMKISNQRVRKRFTRLNNWQSLNVMIAGFKIALVIFHE